MVHALIRKLRHGARLTSADEAVLAGLIQVVRSVGAREDILPQGIEPYSLPLIVDGWACRSKLLEDGRRQIMTLYLPGDICEPFGVLPRFMDHSLSALTQVVLATVSLNAIQDAGRASPHIGEALWWDLLVASAIEREHIVSLGRRSATERLGHLLCELHLRLTMAGLADNSGYEMPLTQGELGDVLGLS